MTLRNERQMIWFTEALAGRHGGFAKCLAGAFQVADLNSALKLSAGFPEIFDTLDLSDDKGGDKPVRSSFFHKHYSNQGEK